MATPRTLPASSNAAQDIAEMKQEAAPIVATKAVVQKPAAQPINNMMNANIIVLPDPEMEKMIKSQDNDLKVIERLNGTVFWASEDMKGTIIRKHMQGKDFENSVEEMITSLKQKCPAVMGIDPVILRKGTSGNLYAYDANCGDSMIGLIFFSKDGQTVSTVSYGANQANKATLENKREKLIDALMENMQS